MSDGVAKMRCSECNKAIKFSADKVGKTAKCPICKKPIKLVDQSARKVDTASQKQIATAQIIPENSVPAPVRNNPSEVSVVTNTPSTPVVDSRISRFVSDGQSPKVVSKLLGRVEEICTDAETPEYFAVQHLPGVMSPDAIVLTNRRVIIFRAKALGRMNLIDVSWLDVADINVKEGVVGASLSLTGVNGHVETIDHLPKKQARSVYRVGQQREEHVRELRRNRKMEEDRNAAGNVVVNTAVATSAAPQPEQDDLTARLAKLKSLMDAGLIEQAEFESRKAQILDSI